MQCRLGREGLQAHNRLLPLILLVCGRWGGLHGGGAVHAARPSHHFVYLRLFLRAVEMCVLRLLFLVVLTHWAFSHDMDLFAGLPSNEMELGSAWGKDDPSDESADESERKYNNISMQLIRGFLVIKHDFDTRDISSAVYNMMVLLNSTQCHWFPRYTAIQLRFSKPAPDSSDVVCIRTTPAPTKSQICGRVVVHEGESPVDPNCVAPKSPGMIDGLLFFILWQLYVYVFLVFSDYHIHCASIIHKEATTTCVLYQLQHYSVSFYYVTAFIYWYEYY